MMEAIFPLRIYIEDTDYGGIVYHANYLKFFERARSEWAESLELGIAKQQELGIYFAVRSAQLDYLKPARLHEKVEVVSRLAEIRTASLVYDQYLRSASSSDTIFCRATIKIACVGTDLRPKAIPREVINVLQQVELAR